MPLWHNTRGFDALKVRGGAIVIGVIDAEAPPTVLPQGAVPLGMVGLFVAAFEAVGEGGALAFPFALVLWYGVQFKAIFTFNIAPLIFRWSLRCVDMWEE